MRISSARMGASFGNLAKVRGIVYHYLSPFEQRAFAGCIKNGVPNSIRRISENVWRTVPWFIGSYFVYDYYENLSDQMKRKDPEKYACDE